MATTTNKCCGPAAPICDPKKEPLQSQVDNLIERIYGSSDSSVITKECNSDDEVEWTLDASQIVTGFPRVEGEGDLEYFIRVLNSGKFLIDRGTWSSSETYGANQLARVDNVLYRSLRTNANKNPTSNPSDWEVFL